MKPCSDSGWFFLWTRSSRALLGNGRNTVSRVLFRRRELTEFYGKLGEFCEKLGELWCTNSRLRGTHWVRYPELSEPQKNSLSSVFETVFPETVFGPFPNYIWHLWGVAEGFSVSWVAKFKADKNSECKLPNGWSRSYKVIKLPLSAGKWVVAKSQGDKSASQSSMELYYPWISGPLRVYWTCLVNPKCFPCMKRKQTLSRLSGSKTSGTALFH